MIVKGGSKAVTSLITVISPATSLNTIDRWHGKDNEASVTAFILPFQARLLQLGYQLADSHHNFSRFFETFYRKIFKPTVPVIPTSENIRCGQSHVRKPAAVGSAPDRFLHRLQAHRPVCFPRDFNDFRTDFNHFAHVEVLVANLKFESALPVTLIDKIRCLPDFLFAPREGGFVVVADNIIDMGVLSLPRHIRQVDEAFALFSVFRAVKDRQQIVKINCHLNSTFQMPLGRAGMNAAPVDFDLRRSRVESLV